MIQSTIDFEASTARCHEEEASSVPVNLPRKQRVDFENVNIIFSITLLLLIP